MEYGTQPLSNFLKTHSDVEVGEAVPVSATFAAYGRAAPLRSQHKILGPTYLSAVGPLFLQLGGLSYSI